MNQLPDQHLQGLLLSYYGDDFTGSTDVMQAFSEAGIKTVLFLQPPQTTDLQRFKNYQCIGLAGQSRGQSTEWMRQHLPVLFKSLQELGAPILQYKICSTFDSSPQTGSIGQAIDIAASLFQANWSPMVVGAPKLRRYQAFGQLFAAAPSQSDSEIYRLDRHPSMSRHPVTPMHEADLRLHLAQQTSRRIELIHMADIAEKKAQQKYQSFQANDQPVVMIDVMNTDSQVEAGRLIWENRGAGVFTASSSGLQYALCAYWHQQGWLPLKTDLPKPAAVSQILVASGSCSPMSALQIDWALSNGFDGFRLNIGHCLDAGLADGEKRRLVQSAAKSLASGRSPIVYSAKGPDDEAVLKFAQVAAKAGLSQQKASWCVAQMLAEVMQELLNRSSVQRIVVAGGDSSGVVASHLGLQALTVAAELTPGVPLCRAWSENPKLDGIEIALKGGQLGAKNFYGQVMAGTNQ